MDHPTMTIEARWQRASKMWRLDATVWDVESGRPLSRDTVFEGNPAEMDRAAAHALLEACAGVLRSLLF